MSRIEIKTISFPDCTLGRLELWRKNKHNFNCFTLELPWLNNKPNISCIPEGHYKATRYQSPKHGDVLLLGGVIRRTYIEIHSGNYTRQIQGCILLGSSISYLDNDSIPDVTNSKNTINELLTLVGNDPVTIDIKRCF